MIAEVVDTGTAKVITQVMPSRAGKISCSLTAVRIKPTDSAKHGALTVKCSCHTPPKEWVHPVMPVAHYGVTGIEAYMSHVLNLIHSADTELHS